MDSYRSKSVFSTNSFRFVTSSQENLLRHSDSPDHVKFLSRLSQNSFTRNYLYAAMMNRYWFAIPAWSVFGLWIIFQIAMATLIQPSAGGVAFMAHLGGVLAGVMFAVYYRFSQKKEYDDWAKRLDDLDKIRD